MRYLLILLLLPALVACDKPGEPEYCDAPPAAEEPYVPVEVTSDWFSVTYIEPRTYQIREAASTEGNTSYLLLGTERAILFDSGTGENPPVDGTHMRHIVDQITDLPVHLVLSHFHYDHVQNVDEFESLVFPEIAYLEEGTSPEGIYPLTNADLIVGTTPNQLEVTDWWPLNSDIDLGGRSVQLLHVPGHADESLVLVDDANQMLFTGDFLYNGALFAFDEADFGPYGESVDALLDRTTSDYLIYGAHGLPLVNYSKLETMVGLFDCLESGDCIGTYTTLWGSPVIIYDYEGLELVLFL